MAGARVTYPIEARRLERESLIELARSYAESLDRRMDVVAAYLVGSVARGDFNVWSDVDVVVISRNLPERLLDRLMQFADAPARIQVAAFTPAEFDQAVRRRNPLATEALEVGVVLTPRQTMKGEEMRKDSSLASPHRTDS